MRTALVLLELFMFPLSICVGLGIYLLALHCGADLGFAGFLGCASAAGLVISFLFMGTSA